jgi:hypothetical protein
LRFLKDRQDYLVSKGLKESMYLIPRISRGKEAVYSSYRFWKLKDELKKATGIDFRIKDFRSTFASLTVKKTPSLMLDVYRNSLGIRRWT